MEKKSYSIEPYKPSRIHKIYSWIDRLPGPYWLYYVGIVVITGLLNLIVAWHENVLALGEINWYYAFTAFFLAYYLFANDFMRRVAKDSLVEFLPILDVPEGERDWIMFGFTHLPARASNVFFLSGAIIGLALGLYQFRTTPEMNYAFPELEVTVYSLSLGMIFLSIYSGIRSLKLIKRVLDGLRSVDIYDLNSIYAMSRYSALMIVIVAIPTYLFFVLAPSVTDYFLLLIIIGWVPVLMIFWLPLQSVNHKLVFEKRRLLTEVNLRIKTTFDLVHSMIDQQKLKGMVEVQETLKSLMLEKEFTESIRTWPWKPSTLTGFLSAIVAPLVVALIIEILSKFITF